MIKCIVQKVALVVLSAVLFYFLIVFLVELFYHRINTSVSKDFNKTWVIYGQYLLPYLTPAVSVLIAFVGSKIFRWIGVAVLYLFLVAWYWVPYIFTTWLYRVIPVILIITSCYILNIFAVEKIKNRIALQQKQAL